MYQHKNKTKGIIIPTLIVGISLAALAFASLFYTQKDPEVSLGGPIQTVTRNVTPETDSTYYSGTTTPSTKAWAGVITDSLCLTGDSCRTTWPSGGGGGSGTVSTSTPLVDGRVALTTGVNTIGTDSSFLYSTVLDRLTAPFASTTAINTTNGYITKLANLTSNGFVKTSSSDGTLSIDTNTYLTGNQSITLSGDVSGSGSTAITTTIGSDKILESMLKAVDSATDEDILTYESTTGDFEWHTCAQVTGSADLCDGNDATGSGSPFAWTPATTYGEIANSTTSPIWFKDTIYASSTAYFHDRTFFNATSTWASNVHNVMHGIWALDSAGLHIHSNVGTPVALLGAGGGAGATFLGGVNIDGATRLATSLSGALTASSGVVSAGTLSVANGGTGAATFTNNRVLTGNGTSAIVDESALTFDGTTLTASGTTVTADAITFDDDATPDTKVISVASQAASNTSGNALGLFSGAGNGTGANGSLSMYIPSRTTALVSDTLDMGTAYFGAQGDGTVPRLTVTNGGNNDYAASPYFQMSASTLASNNLSAGGIDILAGTIGTPDESAFSGGTYGGNIGIYAGQIDGIESPTGANLYLAGGSVNAGVATGGDATLSAGSGEDVVGSVILASGGAQVRLAAADTSFKPVTNDAVSLGVSGTAWSDLFLASGSVVNFNAGDVTLTHSSNKLAFASASSGYTFDNLAIVGGTGSLNVGGAAHNAQVQGTTQPTGSQSLSTFNATAGTASDLNFYRSKNASIGSATVVASGDKLGGIGFYGAQQTGTYATQNIAAQIRAEVDGTVTSGAGADMPGRLVFGTTPDASGTLTDRWIIDAAGVFKPAADATFDIGTTALSVNNQFFDTGAVINFENGDVTITHSSNALAFAGVTGDYTFDDTVKPAANDGGALGASGTAWSDAFLASGAVVDFAGDITLTHASNLLTGAGGQFLFNNTASSAVLTTQSTATNDDPYESTYHARVATTDATETNLFSFTTTTDTVNLVECRIIGRRTGGSGGTAGDSAGYVIRSAITNKSGVVALIGAQNEDMFREDNAAWDIDLEVSGTAVQCNVTGALNNNITWHATVKVSSLGS